MAFNRSYHAIAAAEDLLAALRRLHQTPGAHGTDWLSACGETQSAYRSILSLIESLPQQDIDGIVKLTLEGADLAELLARYVPRDPHAALGRASRAVEELMRDWLRDGNESWPEVAVTCELLRRASPDLTYYKFTQHEEAKYGADWLWVWIGQSGECFLLLVQAKNLKRDGNRWRIGFDYQSGDRRVPQIDLLLKSTRRFHAPAIYTLYCGDREYRANLECEHSHHPRGLCRDREGAAVTALDAQVVDDLMGQHSPLTAKNMEKLALNAFHRSIPLQDLADPDMPQPPLHALGIEGFSPDLQELLRRPQPFARRAARTLLAQLLELRKTHFSAAVLEPSIARQTDLVFPDLPKDRGHFRAPIYPYVLHGLRTRIPDYVADVLAGRTPPAWVTDHLEGMVIVLEPPALTRHATSAANMPAA